MFESNFEQRGQVNLPLFTGTRVMMMPVVIGDVSSIPDSIGHWRGAMSDLFNMTEHRGIGYITIDERVVTPGETHRRSGLHVDGVLEGRAGGVWGGGGGGWGSVGTGMLTVASHVGCQAWRGCIDGWPGNDGECDHLAEQLGEPTVFQPNVVYWVDGLCVHESLSQKERTPRQFVRLSMPSNAPWFEGYTENPLGIKPTGEILPPRKYMSQ
jgi:hypothetical protein